MIDLAVVVEDMDEGERGAGDVLFPGGSQAADNSLREGRFPAAEFPAQHHNHGWAKARRDFAAFGNSFFAGVRDKFWRAPGRAHTRFPTGHVPTPQEFANMLPGSHQ